MSASRTSHRKTTSPRRRGGAEVKPTPLNDCVPLAAYCWASGLIEFGTVIPEGALLIAYSLEHQQLRDAVHVLARLSYPTVRGGDDSKPLVPGIPEAKRNSEAATDALFHFRKQMTFRLKKGGRTSPVVLERMRK